MPELDVIDATWLGVRPAVLAGPVADPANWARWWPDHELEVLEPRGVKGMRWIVRSARGGRVTGTMELWLQPVADGTVAHFFARLDGSRDGTPRPLRPRERRRLEHSYRSGIKRALWALSERHDPGRLARVAAPADRVPEADSGSA